MTIIRGKLRDRPCGPRSIVVGKSDFKRVGDKWYDKNGNEAEVHGMSWFLVSDIGPESEWEYRQICPTCGHAEKETKKKKEL